MRYSMYGMPEDQVQGKYFARRKDTLRGFCDPSFTVIEEPVCESLDSM